jgi:hypothetical protein
MTADASGPSEPAPVEKEISGRLRRLPDFEELFPFASRAPGEMTGFNLEEEERRIKMVDRRCRLIFKVIESYENRNDELIELNEIAPRLADMVPGLSVNAVIRAFLSSVKRGGFGFRMCGPRKYPRRAVQHLADLGSFDALPKQWVIRPNVSTVEGCPLAMRARRSVWVVWIRAQGWPVPPEIAGSILIEAEPGPASTAQPLPAPTAEPAPASRRRDTGKAQRKAPVRDAVAKWFSGLPESTRARSSPYHLTDLYFEQKNPLGSEDRVRKVITTLKKIN